VVLSTHVLSEVEHTCSRLLILSRGRLVADGPVAALVGRAAGAVELRVEIAGDGVLDGLRGLPGVHTVERAPAPEDGRVAATLTADAEPDVRPEIFRLAQARGWTLYELHREAGSLEHLFRQLTAGDAA
jgi:ABC-2 type transport system ATP-binding protein